MSITIYCSLDNSYFAPLLPIGFTALLEMNPIFKNVDMEENEIYFRKGKTLYDLQKRYVPFRGVMLYLRMLYVCYSLGAKGNILIWKTGFQSLMLTKSKR